MEKITVILPLHIIDEEVKATLQNAVNSIPDVCVYKIICPTEVANNELMKEYKSSIIDAGDKTSFFELVKVGVEKVKTKYFSILEFDDMYTPIWYNNVQKYIEYQPETSVFMSLIDVNDFKSGEFMMFGNEAPWASGFSDEIGFIDFESLKNFYIFSLTGSVFKKEDWDEIGGLKTNIKLTFWYEFLLRTTYMNKKVFVIPKIGYVHNSNRDGSLFNEYQSTVSKEESEFWYLTAQNEYYYKEQREVEYNPETTQSDATH